MCKVKKICNWCREEKPIIDFVFCNRRKKFEAACMQCARKRARESRARYKDERNAKGREKYWENVQESREKKLRDYYSHRESRNAKRKKETRKHKRSPRAVYNVEKRLSKDLFANTPNSKLDKDKVRAHIRRVVYRLIGDVDSPSITIQRVGCTKAELKTWIQSRFQNGMSWGNYGNRRNRWSIDHIWPISKWNLASRAHRRFCNHFTNLQPLWHSENSSKRDKMPQEVQNIFLISKPSESC